MGKMRDEVKADRSNKHVRITGIDEMEKDELKETLQFKEYIRLKQAEIINSLCKENDALSEDIKELKKER